MLKRFIWCAAPVAAVAVLAIAPPVARAAGTPGWRIAEVLPNVTIGGVAAVATRDAWLAGDSCADAQCDRDTVIVRHWDGKAWRVVTPPKAFINSPIGQGAGPVVAASPWNAWIFADRGANEVDYTDALHWTRKGWAAPVRLDTMIEAAVAPSANDVWAFGPPEAYPQPGYVAHFDGKTWTHGSFPITGTSASALSASDIWVAGSASSEGLAIEHWDGHTWRRTPLPSLGLGSSNPAFIAGIAALTPHDVWAAVAVANTSGSNPPGTILLHWNGNAWARAAFPYAGFADAPVVSDGHSGIWLVIDAGTAPRISLWFCHDSDGRWTRTAVPTRAGQQPGIDYMSLIPGTRSIWATGDYGDFAENATAILTYGP